MNVRRDGDVSGGDRAGIGTISGGTLRGRLAAALSGVLLLAACDSGDRAAAGSAAPGWAVGTWGGSAFQELRSDSSWSAELIVSSEGRGVTIRYERDGESCAAGLALDSVAPRVVHGGELEETSCDPFGSVVEIRPSGSGDTLFCRWRTREGGGEPGYAWLARR